MPQFAANLSMLYTELPFLDRFEAAVPVACQVVAVEAACRVVVAVEACHMAAAAHFALACQALVLGSVQRH